MEPSIQVIQPVVALVIWSMVMWLWMYATRLPAIAAMKMEMDPEAPSSVQMAQLPAKVRWKADNYNHLMEQPTALVLAGSGVLPSFTAAMAFSRYLVSTFSALRASSSMAPM